MRLVWIEAICTLMTLLADRKRMLLIRCHFSYNVTMMYDASDIASVADALLCHQIGASCDTDIKLVAHDASSRYEKFLSAIFLIPQDTINNGLLQTLAPK